MFKALLTLALVFSFQAFAKDNTTKAPAAKPVAKPTPKTELVKPTVESGNTPVNTNMGWGSLKNDIKETPEEVRQKWDGFTPVRKDEEKVAPKKSASSRRTPSNINRK